MSLDYPYYQELRRRGHPAARWWRVGDALYYVGLLTAIVAFALALLSLVDVLRGLSWSGLALALDGLLAGVTVFAVGGWCKARAYRLGERDGLRPTDYPGQAVPRP